MYQIHFKCHIRSSQHHASPVLGTSFTSYNHCMTTVLNSWLSYSPNSNICLKRKSCLWPFWRWSCKVEQPFMTDTSNWSLIWLFFFPVSIPLPSLLLYGISFHCKLTVVYKLFPCICFPVTHVKHNSFQK